MQAEKSPETLLEKAKAEENVFNWMEAVKLYESAIEFFLKQDLLYKAAETYKKLGYAYDEASHIVDTTEEFIKFRNSANNAFKEANKLFIKVRNKPEELECEALTRYIKGTITESVIESKKILSDSYELMMKVNELYSRKNDQESIVRTLSYAASTLWPLSNCCSDINEFYQYTQKLTEHAKKCWNLSKKIHNVRFLAESLEAEYYSIFVGDYFFRNIRKNESSERIIREYFSRCEESLIIVGDSTDYKALGKIYFTAGHCFFQVGFHLIMDENEQDKYFNKALELLERAVIFSKKTKNKYLIAISLYYLNFVALNARKIEFLQRRINNDIPEILKLVSIYRRQGYYSIIYGFSNLLPALYYTSVAQMKFFTPAQRKFYAVKGIEYAKTCLNSLLFNPSLPVLTWPLMCLTISYSTLTSLTPEKSKRDEYAQTMLQYANQTSKISENFEEGLAKSAGYMCLYRAYKTLGEITENQEEKIKMLSAAAVVQKKYIPQSLESRSGIITAKIRLGLLYEELGIITKDTNSIMQAKEMFLEIIKDCLERGYILYVAAAHEYLARIEDRLGHYSVSAENYEKALEMHKKLLVNIEYKQLKKKVKEKIEYNRAWNLIEQAKTYHKREEHLKSRECYNKASNILAKVRKYQYESSYFNAWALLEEGEQLSKEEKQDNAKEKYNKTKSSFENAIVLLNNGLTRSKEKIEKDYIEKIKKVAKIRINYCTARMNLEDGRILGKKGHHIEAAEKFVLAASQFRNVCTIFKIERERKELEAIYYLCRAWESMELAEQYENPEKFSDASNLFLKASRLFTETKLKLLAEGNSVFCQALEFGIKFDKSFDIQIKTQLYLKVKAMLRKAASIYDKGGYEGGADWALATSTYFDATWNLIRTDETLELNEREKYLSIGARYLRSAAELFNKAGYKDKEEEILKKINRLEKEEKILFSALNTIEQPSISKSTIGIVAPTCPIETSQSPRLGEIQLISEESRRIKEKKLEDSPELYECDTSLNIIHLSDIQEGRFGIKEDISMGNEVYYNYLSDLESKLEILHRKEKIDFVVISGDLASTGSKKEYDNLTKEFIPILNEIFFEGINVVPKHRWIIVPGNHDVEWDKGEARFNNFIQFCHENGFHQYKLNKPEAIYSDIICREINSGNTFGIIGLNSCLDILDENSRNESNISKSYFSTFSKTWDNKFREMPKMMACHHMLHTIKGDKFDHALNALKDNNVLLSLAGDIHKSDSIADEISKIRCIPAGTISASKSEREFGIDAVSRQFNLININLQSGYVKWYTYILEGTWREIKNESFYLDHAFFSKKK